MSLVNPGTDKTMSNGVLRPDRDVDSLLVGTASHIGDLFMGDGISGVFIRQSDGAPGSAFSTIVRGLKSFRGTSEPLYILDGVLLNPATTDAASAFFNDGSDYQAVQNTLLSINPSDIDKIEILKDAAATAVYGSSGANGVVIITTKSGRDITGEKITWHSNVGFSTMAGGPDMLSGTEYMAMMQAKNPGLGITGTPEDWSAAVTRTALVHSHHVSASGTKGRFRHYLSLAYSDEQGVIDRTGTNTLNFKVNLERSFAKNSFFGMRSNFGHTGYDMTMGTTPIGAMSTIKAMTEGIPLRDRTALGTHLDDTAEGWISGYDDNSGRYFIQQSVYVKAQLAKGLVMDLSGGIDYRSIERRRWMGSEIYHGAVEDGRAGQSNDRAIAYNADLKFFYDNVFGEKHRLTATLGTTFNGTSNTNFIIEGYKFFMEDLRADGLELAENRQPSRIIRAQSQQAAVFLSAGYSFDSRYSVSAGIRGDYTLRYDSKFGDAAMYPWVSAAWDIAEEAFLSDSDVVSQLKLHGGWGRSGRQKLDPYLFNGTYITGVDPQIVLEDGIANYYDIRWTSMNDEWNIGLDLGFLNDRVTLSAKYYDSRTKDELRYYHHARKGDYSEIYSNAARVANKGVEIGLQGRIIDSGDWKWSLGASFNYNHNSILSTGAADNADIFGKSAGEWCGQDVTVNVNRKGESVGSFYGYPSQGTVSESHLLFTPPFHGIRLQEGDIKFIDSNGDTRVDENDRTVIGDPNPSFYYGLSTSVSWKGLNLSVTLDGAADFDIMNLNLLNTATYRTDNPSNLRKEYYLEAYPAGNRPRLDATGSDVISSRFIEDGSYLRLSNVQLSYRFDLDTKWIRTLGLAFTARNLCTVTGYSGYSPMVNSYSYDLGRYGIDNASYPLARTFLLTVKATF